MILAGVPEALLAVRAGERTFSVVAGGGEPVLRPFDKGSELQPRLDELMAGPQRQPTASDLEFSALMATPDDQVDFDVLQRQRAMELLAELGLGRPNAVPRNSLCPCGSGMKFKSCCLRRIETGQARSGHVKPRVIFQG